MMHFLLKIIKYFAFGLGILLFLLVLPYGFSPIYNFPATKVFHGDSIYNPYQGMDSLAWHKFNFHLHTHAWGGLTSASGNENNEVWDAYKYLGYDAVVISDYMRINTFTKDRPPFIPTYEHGFGVKKNHQLCINAKKVVWLEYVFCQSINEKQHILNALRGSCDVLAIAHPHFNSGYSTEDMTKLTNYDLIEVFNHQRFSVDHWDSALSTGHPVFIIADDDAHFIKKPSEVGVCCTFINSKSLEVNDLLSRLKQGNAIGVEIFRTDNEGFEEKAIKAREIPRLNSFTVKGDEIQVDISRLALTINFYGQGGKLLQKNENTAKASYLMVKNDTYVRTEIIFPEEEGKQGNRFLLNPVLRYRGDLSEYRELATVDGLLTFFKRAYLLAFVIGIIARIVMWRRKRNNKV